jgi:branched-chain amino acid transport system permease protein
VPPARARRSSRLGGHLIDPSRLDGPATSENAPSDTGQLISERHGHHVVVQPLSRGQLFNVLVCFTLVGIASYYVRMTKYGRATRAIAERPEVAAAFGVNVVRVFQATICLASALAGIGSVSIGFLYGSAWAFIGASIGLKGFVAMLVAGNRYFEGVVIVALGLGILEALVSGYISSSMRDAAAFIVLIGVLYLRPAGIFGSYDE